MISTKELQKKAKEILESLDGLTVGDGISVMVYALSWLIESNVKKEERGECVGNITEMLKTLLVCNDGIEYVRKDAFIEKVIGWVDYNNRNGGCNFDGWEKDFRDYMEGGEE